MKVDKNEKNSTYSLGLIAYRTEEIARVGDHYAVQGRFKVTDSGTKAVCDFVLLNNTNLYRPSNLEPLPSYRAVKFLPYDRAGCLSSYACTAFSEHIVHVSVPWR